MSIASEPELTKNTWLMVSGSRRATRSASAKESGWPVPKGATKVMSCIAWWTASTIFGWQWPAGEQKRPEEASMIRPPLWSVMVTPRPSTMRRGSALKPRLSVKGIHCSSSELVRASSIGPSMDHGRR